MGDSNIHNHKRCPLFFVGKAGGALKGGLHIKAADGTPMANALLSSLHAIGLDQPSLGDSTGDARPQRRADHHGCGGGVVMATRRFLGSVSLALILAASMIQRADSVTIATPR